MRIKSIVICATTSPSSNLTITTSARSAYSSPVDPRVCLRAADAVSENLMCYCTDKIKAHDILRGHTILVNSSPFFDPCFGDVVSTLL